MQSEFLWSRCVSYRYLVIEGMLRLKLQFLRHPISTHALYESIKVWKRNSDEKLMCRKQHSITISEVELQHQTPKHVVVLPIPMKTFSYSLAIYSDLNMGIVH